MQDLINALGGADVRKVYLTIGKGGTFRLPVEPGTPDAVTRSYDVEVDGVKTTKTKTEIHKSQLDIQQVKAISVVDGNYGQSINIDAVIGGQDFTVQLKVGSNYGMDFMEKIPGVDLTKPFTLRGYDFEPEPGKRKRGITVLQGGVKLNSYFYDAEKKEALHGVPQPNEDMGEGEKRKKNWRRYFEDKAEFLAKYMQENVTVPEIKGFSMDDDTEDIAF